MHSKQPESTIREPDKSPVIERFIATTEYFLGVMTSGEDKRMSRTAQLLRMILTEATDELRDAPPEILEEYFRQAAGTMYWAATGERIMNIPLPAGFQEFMSIPENEGPVGIGDQPTREELAIEDARQGAFDMAPYVDTGSPEQDEQPFGPLSPRAESLVESILEDE